MVIAKAEWFKRKGVNNSIFNISWKGGLYYLAAGMTIFIGVMLPQNPITDILITAIFLFLLFDCMQLGNQWMKGINLIIILQ